MNLHWAGLRVLALSVGCVVALTLSLAHAQVSPTTAADVERVVDGDTVDVRFDDGKLERLRLIGMDTPEVVDPRKPVQCFGREASQHAHELLDGQSVTIETDASPGYRDIYGRFLAYIWMPDARNFGEVMIGDGYAHEYTYRFPYVYQDEFKAAQADAMANQRGLWSPATCAGDTTQPATAWRWHLHVRHRRHPLCPWLRLESQRTEVRPDGVHRAGQPLQLLRLQNPGGSAGGAPR